MYLKTSWRLIPEQYELVKDFGTEFASVRDIAIHWYTERTYPRYLYRVTGAGEP